MSEVPGVQLINQIPAAPLRSDEAHKGDCGRVLVVAGSRGMSGAACLAGKAALRGGAGLVTVAVPFGILEVVAGYEPSYLTLGLPDDDHGRIHSSASGQLSRALLKQSSFAVGPGLGQSPALLELVADLYRTVPLPGVFDADALNLLAKRSYLLKRPADAPVRILTPHVGEFARLTELSVETIQANRTQHAADFALKNNLIVVLKGKNTVITDGRRVAINTTGNSGMATGGTGDVLTGVLASLLAQGMSGFDAAQLGVHLHGLAGDLAAEELSKPGMIASDLLHLIGRAWCELGQ